MPALQIEGIGRVEVGPQFLKLSAEEQAATVDEIIASAAGDSAMSAPSISGIDMATDVAKSAGVGVAQGTIGMAGLPGDIEAGAGGLLQRGFRAATGSDAPGWLSDLASGPMAVPKLIARGFGRGAEPGQRALPTSAEIQGQVEARTGEFYKPQTTAGEYARTAGEFVPAAAAMPGGGMVRNALKYGVAPGLASEAAGQATEGTGLEPVARAGAALATGGGIALASRPRSAAGVIRDAAPNLDKPTMNAALKLQNEAARQGAPITFAEAVQQVTNGGTRLGDVQRVVEQSRGGGPIMREFMAGRPEAVQRAGTAAMDRSLGPRSRAPSQIAPRVQVAAQGALDDTRNAINARAEPRYSIARTQTIPNAQFQAIKADPAFREGLRRVRADPFKGPPLAQLPDNSVAVVDEVKKELETVARNAANPLSRDPDLHLAELVGEGRKRIVSAATRASPEYSAALRIGREGRRTTLEPMKRGPIGQLSKADDFERQANIILNASPLPGSQLEAAAALRSVMARDPQAGRELLRTRVEQVFNEATQDLASGSNQFGGAKFRAALVGNSQQAKNLQLLIGTAHGAPAAEGFRRTLDIFEAMGRRQPAGSLTEFNKQLTQELSRGGIVGQGAALAASPGATMRFAKETYDGFRYGRNTRLLAEMLTRPDSSRLLKEIGKLPKDSPRAQALAASLLLNAYGAAEERGR